MAGQQDGISGGSPVPFLQLLASLLAAGYLRLIAARAGTLDESPLPGLAAQPRPVFAEPKTPLDVAARPSADCGVPRRQRKPEHA